MHGQRLRPVILVLLTALIAPTCRKPPVNQPPLRPAIPSGPTRGDATESYQFTTSAIDPEEDSVCIRFDWGDGSDSGWSHRVASGGTVTDSHSWQWARGFPVTAQARDTRDSVSEWSLPLTIVIATNLPPDKPYGLAGPSVTVPDSVCTFIAKAVDREGERVAVRFAWGDGDTSDWSPWFESGEPVSMSHAWSDSGRYEVRAQARDPGGGLSEWSDAESLWVVCPRWRFRTGDNIESSPAIGTDGTVYVGSNDGYLYAINADSPLAVSPWPKFQRDLGNTGRARP